MRISHIITKSKFCKGYQEAKRSIPPGPVKINGEQECIPVGCVPSAAVSVSVCPEGCLPEGCLSKGCVCLGVSA